MIESNLALQLDASNEPVPTVARERPQLHVVPKTGAKTAAGRVRLFRPVLSDGGFRPYRKF